MTTKGKRDIITFNHISDELTESQIDELKSYYRTYHKKMWMYKKTYKRLKAWQLFGNISSVVFATGGLASSIATSGIGLIAIASASVLIQAYMKHKKYRHQTLSVSIRFSNLWTSVNRDQKYPSIGSVQSNRAFIQTPAK